MAKWGSWQDNTRKEKRGDAWRIETYYTCSECGIEGYESDKYCHCCGADMYYSPPQTNADRFRKMSDEEQQRCVRGFWEIEDFADWLKQPAEEESDDTT